jgi:hypothetical protein
MNSGVRLGMTESDVEADEHARELEERRKEFAKKVAVISKITMKRRRGLRWPVFIHTCYFTDRTTLH